MIPGKKYADRLLSVSGVAALLGVVCIVVGLNGAFSQAVAFAIGGITLMAAAIALAGVWCALSWWQEAQASYTKALISYLDDDPDPGEQ